jgi:ribosomal protein S8
MVSENAKAVAREVIETVRKGLKVNLGDIIENHGYASSVSKKPKKVTQTDSYKTEMAPLVDQLKEERQAIIEALKKTRSKAKYRDLIDGLDKVTKNIQLLSGEDTDKVTVDVKSTTDMTKEEIDAYLKEKLNESTERLAGK